MLYDLLFVYLPRWLAMAALILVFPYKERREWYERRWCRDEDDRRKHQADRIDYYTSAQIRDCEDCAAANKWRRTLRARVSLIEFERKSFNEVLGPAAGGWDAS